ncbi:hypothetical protein CCR75_003012 [Bremia lactucae]|uniref:Uncharacterized protein n=1 Tax=Bremia lactucae TaxID=4779 RepID=A0A976FFH3_BRELC|nr:hypothetical protein CCR75_003012 [Bremia lactucae]
MARGPKDILAQPLVSFELQAPAHITSIVCVPVGEGIENCFAVLDQSNRVYILSLMSLNLIWETDIANALGEIERFSLFAEATAVESAMLERTTTRLFLAERNAPLPHQFWILVAKK